jgi:hypothetical protein
MIPLTINPQNRTVIISPVLAKSLQQDRLLVIGGGKTGKTLIANLYSGINTEGLSEISIVEAINANPRVVITTSNNDFTLPDLVSRLSLFHIYNIENPTLPYLQEKLLQELSLRQLRLDSEVVEYLLPRLPFSYYEIENLVEKIDGIALQQSRKITIPLLRKIV